MQSPSPSLLTKDGLVDPAAYRAVAVQRSAWAINHPRYPEILAGQIEIAHEEAKQEKVRRTATPAQLRLAALHRELIDGVLTCDYRDLDATRLRIAQHQPEREALRAKIEAELAEARASAQTPAILADLGIGRAA